MQKGECHLQQSGSLVEPVDAVRVFVVSVLGFLFFFLKNLLPILVLVLVVEGRAGGGRKKFIAVEMMTSLL